MYCKLIAFHLCLKFIFAAFVVFCAYSLDTPLYFDVKHGQPITL
uniref:Uncharacterized protein n=1 Tax=Rhizophora mucronata TaxID=61149 RepID=A0A2P2MJP4_RHIMU